MKKLKQLFAILLVICMVVVSAPTYAFAATAKGTISAASNVATGVKVTWTKDTTKTGYYVYRKAGSATSWSKVKSITKNTTTTWTDTSVKNGTKYTYKVRSYKGKTVTTNNTTKTTYFVSKGSISSLTRASKTSITVKSAKNSTATGFQIRYSTNADMSGYKTLTVTGTTANKTITGLTSATRYYVQLRPYKTVSGTKYYGALSDIKNVSTYYTVYTTNIFTSLFLKQECSGDHIAVRYMSKLTYYDTASHSSKGDSIRLKYDGKYYYAWLLAGTKFSSKFTTTANPYNYDDVAVNPYAQEIIDKAVYIFKNVPNEYSNTEKGQDLNGNGKFGYDCSFFVSHCINTVMQKYNPLYNVTANVEDLSNVGVIYNNGLPNEFKAITVCSGTLDVDKLQPGDVLFYKLPEVNSAKNPNHCVLYLGDNQFIHSTKGADGVEILPLVDNYANNDYFKKAVRFFPEKVEPANQQMLVTLERGYATIYDKIPNDTSKKEAGRYYPGDEFTVIYSNQYYTYICFGEGEYGYIYNKPDNYKPVIAE